MFKRYSVLAALIFALFLTACDSGNNDSGTPSANDIPANAIQISIVYSPEFRAFMPQVMEPVLRAGQESGHRCESGEWRTTDLHHGTRCLVRYGDAGHCQRDHRAE